jgi:hypothetical protein
MFGAKWQNAVMTLGGQDGAVERPWPATGLEPEDEIADLWSAPLDATGVDGLSLGEGDSLTRLASFLAVADEDTRPTGLRAVSAALQAGSAAGGSAAGGSPPVVPPSRRDRREGGNRARGWSRVALGGLAAKRFALVAVLLVVAYLASASVTMVLTGRTPKAETRSPATASLAPARVVVDGPASCPMYAKPFSAGNAAQSQVCFLVA